MIVKKQTFELDRLELVCGATLQRVRAGYETYGRLSPTKDNAILICHHFSGTSDPVPGYWDAVIGPNKPFDTDRYFIVSSDTLCNLNVKDPRVVTTGPASTNPQTGRPYGISFPIVTIRDFVNLQHALIRSLDIERLHAVAGPSMGDFRQSQELFKALREAGVKASSFELDSDGGHLAGILEIHKAEKALREILEGA